MVFGSNAIGGTEAGQPANTMAGTRYTSDYTGPVNFIMVYLKNISGSAQPAKAAIYKESDNLLLAQTLETNVPASSTGWVKFTFGARPWVTSGTSYSIVVWFNSSGSVFSIYWAAGTANQSWYATVAYAADFPATAYTGYSFYGQEATKYSLYAVPVTFFSNGFETGDDSLWSYDIITGAGLTVVSTSEHHGIYCLAADFSAAGANQVVHDLTVAGTPSVIYVRFYMKISSYPANAAYEDVLSFWDTTWTKRMTLGYFNDGGVYKWRFNGGTTTTYFTQTLTLDTWYCVEVKYDADTDVHQVWVNGTSLGTNTDARTELLQEIRVGSGGAGWGAAGIVNVDCYVDASSYIGPEPSPIATHSRITYK